MKYIAGIIFITFSVGIALAIASPHKAARPGAPAVTSPVSVVVPSLDLGAVLQALAAINCKIGDVNQNVCEDTILSVLGDACNILGISISEALSILLECCQTDTLDLSGVFTVLQDIQNTLTECCSTMTQDFQFTWTILADLNDTITDCCSTMTADFQSTWTILADLNDTLTECCSTMTQDFQFTWTILADLNDTITTDFQFTWTILADLNDTITDCCSTMTQDFQFTWTILADLKDTLTNCGMPFAITQALIPFTITEPGLYCLAEDVTLSGTGIIIESDNVILDLNEHQMIGGVVGISVLSEANVIIKNGIVRDQTEANISVDNIETSITNLLIQECQLLDATNNGLQVFATFRDIIIQDCIIISTLATGMDINPVNIEDGSRGLFISNCIIDAGNVGIDIVPIVQMSIANIENCKIQAINDGINLLGVSEMLIVGCAIDRCSNGILAAAGSQIEINNCDIKSNTSTGIFTIFPLTVILNSNISANGGGGINLDSESNNSSIINCSVLSNTGFGIFINNTGTNTIKDCNIKGNTVGDGITINSSNTDVDNCVLVVNGITVNNTINAVTIKDCEILAAPTEGILVTDASGVAIVHCSISGSGSSGIEVDAPSVSVSIYECELLTNGDTGISMGGNFGSIENCSAIGNTTNGIILPVGASSVTIVNCRSIHNGGSGFSLNGTGSQVLNCSAIENAVDGVLIAGTVAEVINSVANLNTGIGFNNTGGATNKIYKNFANANGANYAGVPLVNTPGGALTGTFSDFIANTSA